MVVDISGDRTGYLQNKIGFLDSEKVKGLGFSPSLPLTIGVKRTLQYFNSK